MGLGKPRMTRTLSSSGRIPCVSTRCPRKSSWDAPRTHFAGLMTIPWSLRRCRTWRRWDLCSSWDALAMSKSSMYAEGEAMQDLINEALECLCGIT